MKRLYLATAIVGIATAALLSPSTLEACYVCGSNWGQGVCNGNYNGFGNCAQQNWGCATYGEWCTWYEQEALSPDGALNVNPEPRAEGVIELASQRVAFTPGQTVVRQLCNGAVLQRTYSAAIQVERAAETLQITI